MFGVPEVSVLLPVRNEEANIDDVLADLLAQDFGGEFEVVVADGGSTDGTSSKLADWATRDSRLVLVDNPDVHQAPGLNVAASAAGARTLIRADGHTRYAKDYLSTSVRALDELGGAVGGRMNPVGRTNTGKAVAAAMNNPLTMGPGRFHHAHAREEVDTVYLGCFRTEDFLAAEGFRRFPSGSSEDADFYFRWRASGNKVFIDPAIRSTYSPRERFGPLFRQYWRYGQGKSEMLWANGRFPSLRPLAPIGLILGLLVTSVLALAGASAWPLMVLMSVWVALLLTVGLGSKESTLLVTAVAGVMHVAYGSGAVIGLLRGPGPVRRLSP